MNLILQKFYPLALKDKDKIKFNKIFYGLGPRTVDCF